MDLYSGAKFEQLLETHALVKPNATKHKYAERFMNLFSKKSEFEKVPASLKHMKELVGLDVVPRTLNFDQQSH